MKLKYFLVIAVSLLFFQCKEQKLTEHVNPPAAEGKLAYGHYDLFCSNYEGQNVRSITEGILDTSYYPYLSEFSSDGSKLVFTIDLLKKAKEDWLLSGRDDIFIYDIASKKARRLTNTEYKESMPRFSPDGKTIVFLSDENMGRHLYVMNSDGTGKRLLYSSHDWQWEPVFFPDGKTILFTSTNNALGLSDLYTINLDGTNLTNLTKSPEKIAGPVISGDGRYIYYTYYNGYPLSGIYKFDMHTRIKVKISNAGDGLYYPKVSSDGKYVTFLKSGTSSFNIGVMNSDGSGVTLFDTGYDSEFSHDGKAIFYAGFNGIGIYDIQSKTKKILTNVIGSGSSLNLEVY